MEFEDGITKRFMLAPYVNYTHDPGGHLRYSHICAGCGFPVNKRSENKGEARLLTEFEF